MMSTWVAWKPRGKAAADGSLDSALLRGYTKAHKISEPADLDTWLHPRQRALCGTTVPAGDDDDVLGFTDPGVDRRCKRCARMAP